MVKERRCNLFDDNGKPRRMRDGTRGCPRDASTCHFVHPHEREWKTAHSSLPPRHEAVADSDSNFFYILMQPDRRDREKERERERERDIQRRKSSSFLDSPPHRRDSTTTRASPGPPSSHRSTFDSAIDSSGATKRGRSPALSSTSDQLERLRKDKPYHISDPSRRDYRPRSRSREKGRDKERAQLPSIKPPASSHAPDIPHASVPIAQHPLILPPEPPKPPPIQPPPPPPQLPEVPKPPSFIPSQQAASSAGATSRRLKELSIDEQRSAWHERIDLMFTSIASRRDYTKLESDLSQICMLSNSSLVNNMREADRTRINTQKMALELQIDNKRKEINGAVQKLFWSNFWPILRTPQITEMEKTLEDVKRHVMEVRSLLDTVKSSCVALFKTSASDWPQDLDRPSKRRRLDSEADTLELSTSGSTELMAEETTRELDAFRDKLTELERHLVDLEDDITQRDRVISDEIELHIDARLEEEDALYPSVRGPGEVSQSEIEAVVDARNQELIRAVTTTGEEIGVLAVEVAELITKVDSLEAKCKALEAENLEFKNKLAQDSLDHAKSQDALAHRDKEIEAIAAALQAYISQAPTDQTAGDLPSTEYIIKSLGSHLDSLFRDKFGATMVDIQQQVFDKVQESHNHTLDTVSPKIMLLLKMVNLITARLGKPDMDAANTA